MLCRSKSCPLREKKELHDAKRIVNCQLRDIYKYMYPPRHYLPKPGLHSHPDETLVSP